DRRRRHSCPTRRSSDLGLSGQASGKGRPGPPGHSTRLREVQDHPGGGVQLSGRHPTDTGKACRTELTLSPPAQAKVRRYRLRSRSEEHTSELQSRENLV